MSNVPLDFGKGLATVGLIPAPIEVLGGQAQLNEEIAGEVRWLQFASLFAPKPQESALIVSHDGPIVRAAYKCRRKR
jgi:hypothetical protein